MTEEFEVTGSISVIVDQEIERADNWDEMTMDERRAYIRDEIDMHVDKHHPFVEEVLTTAMETFEE